MRCGQEPIVLVQTAPEICHSALLPYRGRRNTLQHKKQYQVQTGNSSSRVKHVLSLSPSKLWNKVISGITAVFYFSALLSRSLTNSYIPTATVRPAQWQDWIEHQCRKRNRDFRINFTYRSTVCVSLMMSPHVRCGAFPCVCCCDKRMVPFPRLHGKGQMYLPIWLQNGGITQELATVFLHTGGHSINSKLGTCFTINYLCSVKWVLDRSSCLPGSGYEVRREASMTKTAIYFCFSGKTRLCM